MDSQLLYFVISVFTLVLMLNSWIILRLVKKTGDQRDGKPAEILTLVGAKFPDAKAYYFSRKFPDLDFGDIDSSFVMVFLSDKCPICSDVAIQLQKIYAAIKRNELGLYIVPTGPHNPVLKMFNEHEIGDQIIQLDPIAFRMLNPDYTSPLYIFVGEDRLIEATDIVGDEDWISFTKQLEKK